MHLQKMPPLYSDPFQKIPPGFANRRAQTSCMRYAEANLQAIQRGSPGKHRGQSTLTKIRAGSVQIQAVNIDLSFSQIPAVLGRTRKRWS